MEREAAANAQQSHISRQIWAAAAAASTCPSSAPSLAERRKMQVLELSRTKGQGWSQALVSENENCSQKTCQIVLSLKPLCSG